MPYTPYRPPQPLETEDLFTKVLAGYQQGLAFKAQQEEMARRQQEQQRRDEMLQMEREQQARQQEEHKLNIEANKIALANAKLEQRKHLLDIGAQQGQQAVQASAAAPAPGGQLTQPGAAPVPGMGELAGPPAEGAPTDQMVNIPGVPELGIQDQQRSGADLFREMAAKQQQEQQRAILEKLMMARASAEGAAAGQEPYKIADDQRSADAAAKREAAMSARTEAAAIRAENRADAKIKAETAKQGDFGLAKSEGERKSVATSQYALKKMPEWSAWVDKNSDLFGPIAGTKTKIQQSGLGAVLGYKPSKEIAERQAQFAVMRNNMINALSGAAVSPQEYERLKQQVPDFVDPPDVVQGKMKALDDYFRESLTRFKAKVPGGPTVGSVAAGTDQEPPDA